MFHSLHLIGIAPHWLTPASLPWFVILSSFIEEFFLPFPSIFVTIATGSYALAHGYGYFGLFVLSLLAAAAKTFASWLYYLLADKGEDVVVGKFGKYIGLSHKGIEDVGKMMDKRWREDVIIVLARAIPFIPTGLFSFFCGVVKIDMQTFILSSFVGFVIRTYLYLLLGFFGVNIFSSLGHLSRFAYIVSFIVIVVVIAGLVHLQNHRKRLP